MSPRALKQLAIQMTSFEEIDHTADRAFRVTGRDMAALLENAAHAMQALDGPRPPAAPLGNSMLHNAVFVRLIGEHIANPSSILRSRPIGLSPIALAFPII
jgi:Archease protein family (MTH1598/TM1083)